MNNAVTRKLLLLAVLLHAAFRSLADMKECDVSLFAESWIVIVTQSGIIWVDGSQEPLQQLNLTLGEHLRSSARLRWQNFGVDAFQWDMVKLFYTADYSHVLVTGSGYELYDEQLKHKIALFKIAVLDSADLHKISGNSGFQPFDEVFLPRSYTRTCWVNDDYYYDQIRPKEYYRNRYWYMGTQTTDFATGKRKHDWQKLCDIRTLTFIPNEDRFVFDGNKTMSLQISGDHPTGQDVKFPAECNETGKKFRTKYHDLFYPKNCVYNMPKDVPYDMVTDFNNQVKRNKYGYLHYERERPNHWRQGFFFNQLESGKFKLHAEQFTDEDGIERFYHILTRLSPYEIMKEVEKCYIRKSKKRQFDDYVPFEFPRMLLIPKKAGPTGVPIPLLTTTTKQPPVTKKEKEKEKVTLFYPTVPPEMFANLTMFNSTVHPELFANVTIATAPTPTPESGSAPITTASLLILAAVFIANCS